MVSISTLNRVKLLVRFHALRLREFTAADLIRATGLNESSIRSVLNRMNKVDKILGREKIPAGARKRGESAIRYKLTDDPKVRLNLFNSLRDLFPQTSLLRPPNPNYEAAHEKIDAAINAKESQRSELLAAAETDLGKVNQDESYLLAPETINTFVQYERGRISYWQGHYPEAQTHFRIARKFFQESGDESMAKCAEEYLISLEVKQSSQGRLVDPDYGMWVRNLLTLLQETSFVIVSPLIALMREVLLNFPETAGQEMMQETIEGLKELTIKGFEEMLSRLPSQQRIPELSLIGKLFSPAQKARSRLTQ